MKVCTHAGCPLEGSPHPGCTAHVKGTAPERAERRGQPCANRPVTGSDVCGVHGGRAPQTKQAAAVRIAEREAERAMVTLGVQRDISPTEALLEEVRWTAGHVAWLRERVQELEHGALVWGETASLDKRATEFPGVDTTSSAGANVWLELYERERKHLVHVCEVTIKAGVEERRVQLAESQGALVAGAIRRILVRLQLSPEQELLVGEVVPQELRALAGGAA